jgi:hypothetical protein
VADSDQALVEPYPDYVTVEQRVLQENITLVDAKSGILLALAGGFIGRNLDKLYELSVAYSRSATVPTMTALLLYAAASLGFLYAAYCTWFVLRPRLHKTNDFVYWGADVFLGGEKAYIEAIEAAVPADFRTHFLHHLHVLARICRQKYGFFVHAMRAAEFSLLATLAAEIARYASYAPATMRAQIAGFVMSQLHHIHF